MDSTRWDRVGALFDAALAHAPDEREGFVSSSQEPEEVRREVLSLLASHDEAAGFLDKPVDAGAAADNETLEAESELPTLAEGTLVGAYRIGTVLGSGGMGIVYEGYDTRLHRRVAVKSLSPRFSRAERQRERLKQEARAAAALTHPGIATVFALEEVDDQLYIVSGYLDGETLRVLIDRGKLLVSQALDIAIEIAQALAAAHERGIVHRDLKPENVIRTTSGPLKILDFGLAQFEEAARDLVSMTRLTQPGLVAGTPPYMAPEQLLGRDTDSRTDQFSFGVLLYELCTGRHPFGGTSLPSTIARILASEPIPPARDEGIPVEVWQIIERCLHKDAGQRFESTRALVAALESARTALAGALEAPEATLTPRAPSAPLTPRAPSAPLAPRAPSAALAPLAPEAPAPPAPEAPQAPNAIWWWRFHQLAAALSYWFMVWPAWSVHRSFGRAGLFFFFAVLVPIVALTIYTVVKSRRLAEFLDTLSDERLTRVQKWRAFRKVWSSSGG